MSNAKKQTVNAIDQQVKSLANTTAKHNPYALDSQEIGFLKDWANLSEEQRKASNFLIDTLYANGKRPEHFVAVNEKEDKQGVIFMNQIRDTIVEGYDDASLSKLWRAEPKTLSVSNLVAQGVLNEKVRTDYNNLKAALKRRIVAGDKVAKDPKASDEILALRAIKVALDKLGKSKNGYSGIVEDIKALKALSIHTKILDPKASK